MKNSKIAFFVILLVIGSFLTCEINVLGIDDNWPESIRGCGEIVEIERDYQDFHRIRVHNGFQVRITQSEEYSIVLHIDGNIEPYTNVVLQGSTLEIYLDSRKSYSHVTLEADITLPDVEKITLSGASQAVITGFDFDHNMECTLSGASILNGNLMTGNMDCQLSGGSRTTLVGSGENLDINASGGSVIAFDEFSCGDADIQLSGGSIASLNSSGTISANLSGGSMLYYYHNPVMGNIKMSGGSRIEKKG